MRKQNKKHADKAGSEITKRIVAKEKRKDLAREIMPEYMAEDPLAVQEFFHRNRRDAKWNPPKKRA